MSQAAARAQRVVDSLRTLAARAHGIAGPAFDGQPLNDQVGLRRLLETKPDAKLYFGGAAIVRSAGSASIRCTLQDKGFFKSTRRSLIAWTPTGDNNPASLWKTPTSTPASPAGPGLAEHQAFDDDGLGMQCAIRHNLEKPQGQAGAALGVFASTPLIVGKPPRPWAGAIGAGATGKNRTCD